MLVVLACPLTEPADADVTIAGSADALRIEAHDSSVADVLAALSASFKLTYPEGADLSRPISRSLSGNLRQVIAVLLEKYDYVATSSSSGGIDIIWIKPSGAGQPASAVHARRPTPARPVIANASHPVKRDESEMIQSPRIRAQTGKGAKRPKTVRPLRRR
jgi:hypothetical protein